MWTKYIQAVSIDEVLPLLAQQRERARLINGGTDLLIEIERKLRAPELVIDISRIPGLNVIHHDGHTVRLEAGVTHNQVVADARLRERAYALVRACWELGAPQIRNRATLAGNLVTASPANDTISPLWALGASVTLRSLRGERVLALPDFFKGVRRTALEPDEMLTEIAFPLPSTDTRSTFLKLGLRRAQAISVVHVAVVVEFEPHSVGAAPPPIVRSAHIALGSVSPTIVPAAAAQDYLAGRSLDDATIAAAARLAMNAAKPIDDIRGTADYRRAMVEVNVARALRQLRAGSERDTFPARPVMLWGAPGLPNSPVANPNVDLAQTIDVVVNGHRYSVAGGHHKSLLRFLREDLGLVGTKEGCTEGECGACTVFLDGMAVMSCLVAAPRAHGTSVTTVEGLAASGTLHTVQQGLIAEGGVQCGYCTPGFVMSGVKLLEEAPQPALSDIQQAFAGNLCRCTGYAKIVKAMQTASQQGT